jgi:hypothetical protein
MRIYPIRSITHTAALALPLLVLGCKSTPAPAPAAEAKPAAPAITYPARSTTAPAPFKVFHHYDSSYTLTTPDKATDDQLAAIVWQIRDAARAHTIDSLHVPGLTQKDVDAGGNNVWFHIYRGPKCATEKYTEGKIPCGASYHASADYTFSKVNNQPWDKGVLLHDEKETALWNTEAPYTPK